MISKVPQRLHRKLIFGKRHMFNKYIAASQKDIVENEKNISQ